MLIVQTLTTLFMTGLIWFVQIVHYPLMGRVGGDAFGRYEAAHTRLTTWVVGPPMLAEGVTAIMILVRRPAWLPAWQAWTGLALLALIWISTAALQVPAHRRLAGGFDPAAHRRLVSTNWIRVVAWSLRAALVLHWAVR